MKRGPLDQPQQVVRQVVLEYLFSLDQKCFKPSPRNGLSAAERRRQISVPRKPVAPTTSVINASVSRQMLSHYDEITLISFELRNSRQQSPVLEAQLLK
jgi:hypothetical protein